MIDSAKMESTIHERMSGLSLRNLIREGSRQILLSAGLLARNRFILPSRHTNGVTMDQGVGKTFMLLTVARQPGILTRFPFNHSRLGGKNRNKYVNEQYNTTKPEGLMKKN